MNNPIPSPEIEAVIKKSPPPPPQKKQKNKKKTNTQDQMASQENFIKRSEKS